MAVFLFSSIFEFFFFFGFLLLHVVYYSLTFTFLWSMRDGFVVYFSRSNFSYMYLTLNEYTYPT